MASSKTPPEMITPLEMSKRCGVSDTNIKNQLRLGLFPVGFAFYTGSKWRYIIPRAEFEDWMAGKIPSGQNRLLNALSERLKEDF